MKVTGMIFAAGLGTRLAPLTDKMPKALVEVQGVAMLERVVKTMVDAGVGRIVVNVHHFAPAVKRFLADDRFAGIDIIVSDESDLLLDTGGGLAKAAPYFADADCVLVHNADILTDVDLRSLLARHIDSEADATLLVSERKSSRCLLFDKDTMRLRGWMNVNSGNTLPEGFIPGPDVTSFAFGGVHVLSRSVVSELKRRYAVEKVFSVIPFYVECCARLDIRGYLPGMSYQWFDIGSLEKLQHAEKTFIPTQKQSQSNI